MSNLYVIHVSDMYYKGLSGIESIFVTECLDFEDACEIAEKASLDLIHEHKIFEKAGWGREALEKGYKLDTLGYADYLEKCCFQDTRYEVYQIQWATFKSLEQLNDEIKNNYKNFINEYCIKNNKKLCKKKK